MKPTPLRTRIEHVKRLEPDLDIDPTKAVSDLYDKLTGPLQ